jgi:sugar phosphate isomerase/epimerase
MSCLVTPRIVTLDIGLSGAFITRRWEDPDNWMRLTKELGYPYHEFCGDVLDPFFMGDKDYQLQTAQAVREAAEKYGVKISAFYTGMATHRFHGLSHSDPAVRARMREWVVQAMDLALAMGTDRLGGHWDAFSVEVVENDGRRAEAFDRICEEFRALSRIAAGKGLAALYDEQMYIPSEVPWTIDQAHEFMARVNRDNRDGVPVYLTVDTGHAAGMHYGAAGRDLNYRAWLREFAAVSENIHLQQTTPDASAHWPFTQKFNAMGHVRMEEVLAAIEDSHRRFRDSPLAQFMTPVSRSYLVLEVIPGSTKTETALLDELAESARYLRRFIPEGGLTLEISDV